MNARTYLALRRLDPGTPKYVDEPQCDALTGVACVSLIVPEQTGVRTLRRLRLPPYLNIFTQCRQRTVGQRQDSGFEEFCLTNGNRARSRIDVTKVQPCKLSDTQSCAIGQYQHGEEADRAQWCAWRWIGPGDIKKAPDFFRAENVGPTPLSLDLLLWTRIRAFQLDARIDMMSSFRQDARQLFAFSSVIGRGTSR